MAVKIGQTAGAILLGATSADITIQNVAANRTLISAASLQNNAGLDVSISIYRSPDATSASGELVDVVAIPDGGDADINAIIGQGLSLNEYIIAVVDTATVSAGAVISSVTYTDFTAGS
tara:strand:- start:159 stop:515 length:357 start_codon:yes stop_codon:yes gene_type:complete